MVDSITPTASQGVISTQMEQVQNDSRAQQPPPQQEAPVREAPPAPPPDSDRGGNVDTQA